MRYGMPVCLVMVMAASICAAVAAAGGDRVKTRAVLEYERELAGLDVNSLDSIGKGLKLYEQKIAKLPAVEDRDQGYIAFRKFFNQVAGRESNRLVYLTGEANKDVAARKRAIAHMKDYASSPTLRRNELRLMWTEASPYLTPEPDYFMKHFGALTSPPIRDYLAIDAAEMKAEDIYDEMGLHVSFDELAQRLARWEDYTLKYPDSPYRDEIAIHIQSMLGALLIDNLGDTPVIDPATKKVLPQITAVWDRYLKDRPSTPTAEKLARFYAILKKHDVKLTPAAIDELKSNGFKVSTRNWPK